MQEAAEMRARHTGSEGASGHPAFAPLPDPRLRKRAPRLIDLEPLAARRLPSFCFDFLEGGTGLEQSRTRNMRAFDSIEIAPRYGDDIARIDTGATLFGTRLSAPLVIAPIGMDGAIWPGATRLLARAARETGIAYMTGTLAAAALEDVARDLPRGLMFQLYGLPNDDHRLTFDLVERAARAGIRALAVTVDIPLPGRRVRDMRNGLALPFHLTPRMALAAARRPAWLAALAREGMPRFANLVRYCPPGASKAQVDAFVRDNRAGGGMTWEVIARLRDAWRGSLLVKGTLHPADALRAAAIGADGLIVSNHGGRQFDPAPAPVDVLPGLRAAVGDRMTLLLDSGVMSGTDMLRAIACGADAVMVGRGFMLGLAALGAEGARHVAETLIDEFRIALGQSGAMTVAGARSLAVRHPGAWRAEDFGQTDTPAARRNDEDRQ